MSEDGRLEAMIAAACLGARSEEDFTSDLRGFLAAHGVTGEDAEAILAAPPRLALYRRLVRNNLTGVAWKMLKRTRARLNAAVEGAFDASFDAFLDEAGPRTHYLRDVPGEFLAWVEPRWRGREDVPAWIADYARHELVEFQVAAAPSAEVVGIGELRPDRPLVFAAALRLVQYTYAVHALPSDESDRSAPDARPTALLVYRTEDDGVEQLALTPLQAAIVERLLAGVPLAQAVLQAGAIGTPAVPVDVATFLADLAARGVVLGGLNP